MQRLINPNTCNEFETIAFMCGTYDNHISSTTAKSLIWDKQAIQRTFINAVRILDRTSSTAENH